MKLHRLSIFIVFLTIGVGQEKNDSNFWNSLSETEKVTFVQGVFSGITESLRILGDEAARQKSNDRYWTPPFSHENSARRLKEFYVEEMPDYTVIAQLLDAFYSNPDNAHIDIMYALHVLMLHQSGKTQRANELLLLKQKEVLKGK